MNWSQICEDKLLQDLPYSIELNRQGQIIMTPHRPKHSGFQGAIIRKLLELQSEGYAVPELAVDTDDGTKTIDVAWISSELFRQEIDQDTFRKAPEICIEIMSPSNTLSELLVKRDLYLSKGAQEVWVCDENGTVVFYSKQGEIEKSLLFPQFPKLISL